MEGSQKPTLVTGIVILAVVIAAVVGYFVWKNFSKTAEEKAAEALQQAAQTGTLPTINPLGNPAKSIPNVNPIDKANPFGNTYQNPFK